MATAFVHGDRLQSYNPSDDDERPLRRGLGLALIRELGLLERDDVRVVDPPPATEDDVVRIHAPAYVATVRRFSDDPALASGWDAAQWGLAPGGDTPARAG